MVDKCPVCGTPLADGGGIGPYCPKKSCPVTDDADLHAPSQSDAAEKL